MVLSRTGKKGKMGSYLMGETIYNLKVEIIFSCCFPKSTILLTLLISE